MNLNFTRFVSMFGLFWVSSTLIADGWDPETKTTNTNSIANSRHNLTVSFSFNAGTMNIGRSDYQEVCVYCHTPHGSNRQITAPLWNRTINTSQYTIYDKARTLNQPIGQPGPNSLTCLSCHDGSIAIDSIINMPGSGNYSSAQETSVNEAFLDTWNGPGIGNHWTLGPDPVGGQCTFCHTKEEFFGADDYTVFVIGMDLKDDHPIGVLYPNVYGDGYDFNQPTASIPGKMAFFDTNGDSFPDANEVRLYDVGGGNKVECASCHDPHGVPSAGSGTKFNPSFLRVNNGVQDNGTAGTAGITSAGASALCLTCHDK